LPAIANMPVSADVKKHKNKQVSKWKSKQNKNKNPVLKISSMQF
jgi:hypothetical protein